ncbi:MAG: hypothetical protein N2559_13140, partial [Anaerolineae bacterium]|nr:hypothetical protein [Anaerolineae bacterium]
MNLAVFETRLGWIGVAFSERGLAALELRSTRAQVLTGLRRAFPDATLVDAAPSHITRELIEYAEGKRRAFTLPLDWSAMTPFQRKVLRATASI